MELFTKAYLIKIVDYPWGIWEVNLSLGFIGILIKGLVS
jgi:hypothetical protein